MTELDQHDPQTVDDRIAELEAEVARLQGIEHGLELAATHAQRIAGRLQSILNNTSDAVITLNDIAVIETVNPSTEAMFCYDHGELIGQHASILVTEPGRTRVDAYMDMLTHRKAPPPGSLPDLLGTIHTTNAVRKDGTVFPVDLSVSEAMVEGKPVFTGIIRDVTERVQAHQRVAESEQRSRLIFANAPIGLFLSSTERSITQANPALLSMLGRTHEEIVGKRLSDFGAPGYEQPARTRDRLVQDPERDEPLTSERAILRGDGTLMWAKVTASAIRDDSGELLYVLRMVEDITAQREAEAKLSASEERFRELFQFAPIGIAIKDRDNHIRVVNNAFLGILKRSEDQVVGKSLLAFAPTPRQQPGDQSHDRMVAGDFESREFDREWIAGDGSTVSARGQDHAVRDKNGVFQYTIMTVEDVTDRKIAEEELRG